MKPRSAIMPLKYDYSMTRKLEGVGFDNDKHILNFVLGCRFLKGNRGTISISGIDVLSNAANYSMKVTDIYTVQTWRPSFGRYFMINFSYRFNHARSGAKKYNGSLNSGTKSEITINRVGL